MKLKKNIELNDNTLARLYEIAMAEMLHNIKVAVGAENVDYFLEHFCRMFKIDFTTMSIIKNMYASKIRPTKREHALFAMVTDMPLKRLQIDYRTLRKYVREMEVNGLGLFPHVINDFMKPVIRVFVESYITLMYDNLFFVKQLTEMGKLHEKTE
jgi:hypothetical protein